MSISRRHFLALAGAGTSSSFLLAGLENLYRPSVAVSLAKSPKVRGYGALVKDPQGILDLPAGFRYKIVSQSGKKMSDGTVAASNFDGMAAFAGKNGSTILVRNHELYPTATAKVIATRDRMYDPNCGGGTTTLTIDRNRQLVEEYVSLAGTNVNCAGGATPWRTWISCEENTTMPGMPDTGRGIVTKPHGYNFEVGIDRKKPLAPVPLVAMGRFRHEAIEVDPRTGIVYQTEDDPIGLFYRFIPKQPGKLAAGGVLEALKIVGKPQVNTTQKFPVRQKFAVEWVRIEEPNPPENTVRREGFTKGAAQFMRGEGICYVNGSFYFTCTQGGNVLPNLPVSPGQEARGNGQIWKYTPGKTAKNGGSIELFLEPNDDSILDMPDNITVAPSGHLIACEDGKGEQRLVGITPQGGVYTFARNARDNSEFAGACFSADGRTMFVNIYDPGLTLAVWGNWTKV
ncbi:alkaline phosphatase PhoX [Chamaesiphon polymorphus]|uniref:Phosphatase n=1 Tax=Chamaesiphon polymorphus CCALA 037 TaxID=2107692 RepID=A0A2T1GAN3_9CYAN|nr:alkaline phosphatase PhoX [Chamaesiphon polymorphus]PSB54246.1 phosphatase [Chamaesiphon polymorphus CCALA 037]